MSSNVYNLGNLDGDEPESSTHIGESDENISTKLGMRNALEKLITEESKKDGASAAEPLSQLSQLRIMCNVEDKQIEDKEKKSRNHLNNQVTAMDQTENHCSYHGINENAGSQAPTNNPNKINNAGPNIVYFNSKEYDASIDERLPETVTLLGMPDGGKLYLIGTTHFSIESQNEVATIIQAVRPHVVVLELCKTRTGILNLNEEVLYSYVKNISFQCMRETLKEYGLYNGLAQILFLRMVAHFTKQLGMAPGGEFRRAFEEASKIPYCIVSLADRPIGITIRRAVQSLSWWETIKLVWDLTNMKDTISPEEVELYKQRDLLDALIDALKEEYPRLEKVFIEERDLYLTYSLQLTCLPQHTPSGVEPARVVAVVGLGHVPGILRNWGKVKRSDIVPLLSIPPQTLSTKILKFTVRASLLSAVVYLGYKIIPLPSGLTIQSIKSSVQGLLKISVAK